MTTELLKRGIDALVKRHQSDPNKESINGIDYPAELLYAQRMADALAKYVPDASKPLQLAAWSHHIMRWEVARSLYPMGKSGYYQWRQHVLKHQLKVTKDVLTEVGISSAEVDLVTTYMQKDNRRTCTEAQTVEDIACVVFVVYYLEAFAQKHSEEKVIDIIRKTMLKVSEKGKVYLSKLALNSSLNALLAKA